MGDTRSARRLRGLARRRREAARLFEDGFSQADVARRLKVSRVSAMRWFHAWRKAGSGGLTVAARLGRPSKLGAGVFKKVERGLLRGPQVWGYSTHLWTLRRMAEVIEKISGVRYHPGHVWRLLRQMGWSLQRPTTRGPGKGTRRPSSAERRSPRASKKMRPSAPLVFVDESGFSEQPAIRRTWARRGQTPVHRAVGDTGIRSPSSGP
jgi:transposase